MDLNKNMNQQEKPGTKTFPYQALPMERSNKLKVFAISSPHKDVPKEVLEKPMTLTLALAVTYTQPEALIAARESLKAVGANPDNYLIGRQIISLELDQVVQTANQHQASPFLPPIKPDLGEQKKRSVEEMCNNIRYVFGKVGTKTQKESAEKVIQKFKDEQEAGGNTANKLL